MVSGCSRFSRFSNRPSSHGVTMSSLDCRAGNYFGLSPTVAWLALGLIGSAAGALAQDASSSSGGSGSASSASTSSGSSSGSASGDAPILFSPSVTTPISQFELVRSVTTPSGFSPFNGTSSMPQGLHFSIDQAGRYDDNARRLTGGVPVPPRRSRGDFYSVTTLGGSASAQLGLQTVYVRGSYGLTRYRVDTDLNADLYSVEAGINWRTGSACTGTLSVSTNQSELGLQDVTIGTVRSLTNSDRADFQGRCHLIDRLYATFGASGLQYEVSNAQLNNYRQAQGRGGLEYALPKLYTIGVETVYRDSNYFNRVGAPASGLTTDLQQQDVRAYFRYNISPKTTINLSGGIANFQSFSPIANSERTLPIYSASISWRATPKILLNAGTEYSVGPATGIVSDYQQSTITTVSAIYTFSPKLSFSTIYAHATTTNSVFSAGAAAAAGQELTTDSASIDMTYRVTPRLYASMGYRFSEQNDNLRRLSSASNLYTISLNYRR